MKHKSLFYFFSIILSVVVFSISVRAHPIKGERPMNINIDFSGVEKFLELTALLEKDQEPTQEQWDDMFDTPGYKILILREFNKNFLMERIKLAFMPSKKEALKAKLKEEKGFWAQFLPHFVRAKSQRKLVEEQVARFKSVDFIKAAVDEAREFLPDVSLDENLPLSFVISAPIPGDTHPWWWMCCMPMTRRIYLSHSWRMNSIITTEISFFPTLRIRVFFG